MDEYLLSELHRSDLLREAEEARIGAELSEPHAWRHRMGEVFIRLGQQMVEEPARHSGGPSPQVVRGADEPRQRAA